MLKLLFLTIFMVSCGTRPQEKSSIRAIIGDSLPNWRTVDIDSKFPVHNVYSISNGKRHIATGFILKNDSKYFITNAHVALKWKIECRRYGCPDIIARNQSNEIQIININSSIIDMNLDISFVEFKWVSRNNDLATIPIAKSSATNYFDMGNLIYVLGFSVSEFSFVYSEGLVLSHNFDDIKKPSFHYDADTEPGMSGSPVFNSEDKLIGIHYGTKRNVNRAIPIWLIQQKFQSLML